MSNTNSAIPLPVPLPHIPLLPLTGDLASVDVVVPYMSGLRWAAWPLEVFDKQGPSDENQDSLRTRPALCASLNGARGSGLIISAGGRTLFGFVSNRPPIPPGFGTLWGKRNAAVSLWSG